MKSIFLATFLTLFSITVYNAQISVYKPTEENGLKENTTYFLYRESDEAYLAELEACLKKNWMLTKIVLVAPKDLEEEEINVNDLVFNIHYNYRRIEGTYMDGSPAAHASANFVDFYLALSKKTETGYITLSNSSLSVHGSTIGDVCLNRKQPVEIIANQYKKSTVLFSWNYIYLATILHTVSENLSAGKEYYSNSVQQGDLSGLKKKKLYIADAVESKQNRTTGEEKKKDYQSMIDKNYDYSFEIVTNEKINELSTSDEVGYVLMFQKVGKGKTLLIIDMETKSIIYSKFVKGSYKFEKKDIRKLNKAIAK